MLSTVWRSPSSGSSAASHTKLLRVHNSVAMYRFPRLRALASSAGTCRDTSTKLSLIHERPDHEILRHVQFPREPDALVAQDRQRLLG